MNNNLLLILLFGISCIWTSGSQGQCPSMSNSWECTTDYCYKFKPLTYKSKADADTYCKDISPQSSLLHFESFTEFQNFTSLWSSASSVNDRSAYLGALAWLGLDSPSNVTNLKDSLAWTWNETASALSYSTAWADSYPIDANNFVCAMTNSFSATWTNTLCSTTLPTICQFKYNSSYCTYNECRKCLPGWIEVNNYCYFLDGSKTFKFEDMVIACERIGATLPELPSVADADAYAGIQDFLLTYLGLKPISDKNYGDRTGWVWQGAHSLLKYGSKWSTNQPLNDVYGCAVMTSVDGTFLNTVACDSYLPLTCQMATNTTNCA